MGSFFKLLVAAILLSCTLCIPTPFAVPAPSGVRGYVGTEVHFRWGESTGQPVGYRIYWGEIEGGPHPNRLCEVNATVLTYTARLNSEENYFLICRAYNEYGESDNSNEVIWPAL